MIAEGCTVVRSEKVSGGSREGRTELATVIDFLRPGNELVVTRLGRDTRDILNLIYECEQRGAFVTVLDPHASTQGPMGYVMLTVLGIVAEKERRFIKERQRDGIAREVGRSVPGRQSEARSPTDQKHEGQRDRSTAISKAVGCSRMQVYRVCRQ